MVFASNDDTASNDNSLSSDQDTNRFLMYAKENIV